MRKFNIDKTKKIKEFIFNNGRLLERKLFSYFFEEGTKEDVIKALIAYQNKDGGFGNGIEPDLLCPDSSAIGAETALYIYDLLEISNNEHLNKLIEWIFKNQNERGYIDHPPENLSNYPHQPWWKNPDDSRILALAGILKRFNVKNEDFFGNVRNYYLNTILPKKYQIYDYPYFVYLKYCSKTEEDQVRFTNLLNNLAYIIEENRGHFPLFSRHWFYLNDLVDKKVLKDEAEYFIVSIQEDGGLKIVYENLAWWRPIWTLDGLIIMKKSNIIDF